MSDNADRELLLAAWRACLAQHRHLSAEDHQAATLTIVFLKTLRDQLCQELPQPAGIITEHGGVDHAPLRSAVRSLWDTPLDQPIDQVLNATMRLLGKAIPDLSDVPAGIDFTNAMMFGGETERLAMLRDLIEIIRPLPCALMPPLPQLHPFDDLLERYASLPGPRQGVGSCPREVAELLAALVDPRPGERLGNPDCGLGDLLIACLRRTRDLQFAVRETSSRYRTLCRMRLAIHGCVRMPISALDGDSTNAQPCQVMVADMSTLWSMPMRKMPVPLPGMFSAIPVSGVTEPLRAFCVNIHRIADAAGRGALLVPHGPLFRQGSFGDARRILLEANLLDAVIGLPASLLNHTNIPSAILVLSSTRRPNDPITIVDAGQAIADGRRRTIPIGPIVDAVRQRRTIAGFSRQITAAEIVQSACNFSPSVYITPPTPAAGDATDIDRLFRELDALDQELHAIRLRRHELFGSDADRAGDLGNR